MCHILFVCTGNICRSPVAEVLLRHKLATEGKADYYEVASAGTWTVTGQPASADAKEILANQGIDLDYHRSREVNATIVRWANLILVMTESHREALVAEFPFARSKTYLLSEMASRRYDIADPYGDAQAVAYCITELDDLIEKGYSEILRLAKMKEDTVIL